MQLPVAPRSIALAAGPLLGLLVWLTLPVSPERALAAPTAGVAVWMGIWWLTEAVPLAVTSLLPLALLPMAGVLGAKEVAGLYMNDVVFLFVGGFLVALAMEKWGLHRRIALHILHAVGGGARRTLLGFMAATALLSMWISNTATTMMLVPIAMAVLGRYDEILSEAERRRFAIGLLLGIAYAASVGGIATLVGTPTNLVFASQFPMLFPEGPEINFTQWMLFALPLSLVMFAAVWGLLSLLHLRGIKATATRDLFRSELDELGPASAEEKRVLAVFVTLALAWVSRKPLELGSLTLPGWSQLLPEPGFVGDGTTAMLLGILLFVLPGREKGQPLLDWPTARKLPWGIVLLFGGGFALAGAITASGLSVWIGERMQGLSVLPPMVLTGAVASIMTFLTEFTSNTATTQMALPVLGSLAVAIGRNPFYLMIPATLSASCAFMMPVATPPNAIVFGTGRLRVLDMAKTGILLNLAGIVLITLLIHLLGPLLFSGSPLSFPDWAHGGP